MAKTVIVKLTDDIDGGDADETVQFALDGKSYEVDLSAANAANCESALSPTWKRGARALALEPELGQRAADTGHALFAADGRREGTLPGLGRHADGSTDQ